MTYRESSMIDNTASTTHTAHSVAEKPYQWEVKNVSEQECWGSIAQIQMNGRTVTLKICDIRMDDPENAQQIATAVTNQIRSLLSLLPPAAQITIEAHDPRSPYLHNRSESIDGTNEEVARVICILHVLRADGRHAILESTYRECARNGQGIALDAYQDVLADVLQQWGAAQMNHNAQQ